jgi:hypothetical protein
MSFKHGLKMLNSASKCLNIPLKVKVIQFSKPEKKFPKNQVDGGISPHVKFMPGVNPPLYETLKPHCVNNK